MPNEAGIGDIRATFIRETTPGSTPTDPTWLLYSDELESVGEWSPNANLAVRRKVGSPDAVGFSIGAEDHEMAIAYKLQRWLTQATAVPLDALADGLLRNASGYIINRHSVLIRQKLIAPAGTQVAGSRIYTYGTGGIFASASLSGDPSTSEPVIAAGTYRFEKMRSLRIDQMLASGTLTVVSSDAADTTQSVVLEADGGSPTETLALNGTTPVVGVTSFTTLDSIRLSAACVGDVTVTFTSGGEVCCVVLGSASHQGIAGDLGIPSLGSGSFPSALGTAFEHILGDTIQKGGASIETNVMALAINVANNIQADPVTHQKSKVLSEGDREVTVNATLFSETGSHDRVVDHLKATAGDITWAMTGGTITCSGSVLTGPGGRKYEKGAATMRRDNVFTSQGLTISP